MFAVLQITLSDFDVFDLKKTSLVYSYSCECWLATSRYGCARLCTMVSDVMAELPQPLQKLEQISTNRNLPEQPTIRGGGLATCNETREGMRFHRFGSDKNHRESTSAELAPIKLSRHSIS